MQEGEISMARRRRSQQPNRVPTGLPHGQRQQLEQAQRAIPLPAAPSATGGRPPEGGGEAAPPIPAAAPALADSGGGAPAFPTFDVFGPTERPEGFGDPEMMHPDLLPPDTVGTLRALAAAYPEAAPALTRLILRADRRRYQA